MNKRTQGSIDVKLFYLYAASIIEYEMLNVEKKDRCYCTDLRLKDIGDAWIYIDIDGEGTVEVNNERYAVFGEKEISDGKWIKATKSGKLRLYPSFVGMLGEKEISLKGIYLIYFEPSSFRYLIKAKLINEASKVLNYISEELRTILDKSLDMISISSIPGKNLEIAIKTQLVKAPWYLIELQDYTEIKDIEGKEIDYDTLSKDAERAESLLERELDKLRNKVGPIGILDLISHAHIDFAWLWDENVTKQKVYRNISNVISLMKNNDFLIYAISNVVYLKWLKDEYPDIFQEVKNLVKEGKIIPVGGMWVESDTNLPGGESLVRQFLYGQEFLLKEFGKTTKVGWLPDSFGFSGQMPQILKKSGIMGFYTHKLYWNTVNRFPYSVFMWKGIDGTEIPAINYPTYGSDLSPSQLVNAWNDHSTKDLPSFLVFGHGDGGGGPTWQMLERFKIYKDFPGLPKLNIVSPEFHMEEIWHERKLLPIWRGELYLEMHRGVYSNGIKLKKLIREVENLLIETDTWSSLLGIDVNTKDYWLSLLEFEFHDSISATTTFPVYEGIVKQLERIKEELMETLYGIFRSVLKKESNKITFFNYLPWERKEIVKVTEQIKGMICQEENEHYLVEISTPPSGFKSYEIGPCSTIEKTVEDFSKSIENDLLKVEIAKNKVKIYDKKARRYAIKDFYLISCEDMPEKYDGWDIDASYSKVCEKVTLNHIKTTKGPLKSCLIFDSKYKSSEIKTSLCLYKSKRTIEITHHIDWHENLRLLKAIAETGLFGQYNHAEIPYGVIERSSQPSNSWDEAKFESPMWRWSELWDPDYGISIINEGRQGYNAISNKIGLTLLRSPLFPNPRLDRGKLEIRYWIYLHQGSWREALTPKVASELNNRIKEVRGSAEEESLLMVDPTKVMFGSLKKEEKGDGIILRIWESYGKNASLRINSKDFIINCETDMLENKLKEIDNSEIHLKPFEIKTIKMVKNQLKR